MSFISTQAICFARYVKRVGTSLWSARCETHECVTCFVGEHSEEENEKGEEVHNNIEDSDKTPEREIELCIIETSSHLIPNASAQRLPDGDPDENNIKLFDRHVGVFVESIREINARQHWENRSFRVYKNEGSNRQISCPENLGRSEFISEFAPGDVSGFGAKSSNNELNKLEPRVYTKEILVNEGQKGKESCMGGTIKGNTTEIVWENSNNPNKRTSSKFGAYIKNIFKIPDKTDPEGVNKEKFEHNANLKQECLHQQNEMGHADTLKDHQQSSSIQPEESDMHTNCAFEKVESEKNAEENNFETAKEIQISELSNNVISETTQTKVNLEAINSKAALPEPALPEATLPELTLPETTLHEVTISGAIRSEATLLMSIIPEATNFKATKFEASLTGATVPEGTHSNRNRLIKIMSTEKRHNIRTYEIGASLQQTNASVLRSSTKPPHQSGRYKTEISIDEYVEPIVDKTVSKVKAMSSTRLKPSETRVLHNINQSIEVLSSSDDSPPDLNSLIDKTIVEPVEVPVVCTLKQDRIENAIANKAYLDNAHIESTDVDKYGVHIATKSHAVTELVCPAERDEISEKRARDASFTITNIKQTYEAPENILSTSAMWGQNMISAELAMQSDKFSEYHSIY